MACIKPSGYRYWIDNDDGNWYRSPVKMTALLGLYSAPKWVQLSVRGDEAATPIKDAARRRVDQPARFPDADGLLTAMLGFLDVSVVGVSPHKSTGGGVGPRARARSGNASSSGAGPTVVRTGGADDSRRARAVSPAGLSSAVEGDDARGSLGSLRASS